MSETSKCSRCGASLPPDSPEGLCPRCLMALNLATQTEISGEPGTAKTPPTPPLPVADVAKLFPQLEIIEFLGRGGMGAVYKARQPRLDRFVALKILSPEKQGNQKFAERFEREARALARLHHPNIVAVYDFGETQGNFYLLMEYVDGATLRQLIAVQKLPAQKALAIVPKICEALQYAHGQGIIHRDIKPENILIDKSGEVKIADFGIAKILGDNGNANLTAEQVIGTPHYMSPEQIEKPLTVDHRADIYSLGVVFYEMLTGELPLGKFLPPSKKVQIDVRLDEVVLRALEKEPERRYQQASEVKTRLETIAATPETGGGRRDEGQIANQNPPAAATFFRTKKPLFTRIYTFIAIFIFGWYFFLLLNDHFTGSVNAQWWGFFDKAFFVFWLLSLIQVWISFRQIREAKGSPQSRLLSRTLIRASLIGAAVSLAIVFYFIYLGHHTWTKAVKSDYIGKTWFPQGDSIEIISVERTENRMTVRGHFNLVSHDQALLALYVTAADTVPSTSKQEITAHKGQGAFVLTDTNVVSGLPHISMYADGRPFASVYFGSREEAAAERNAAWISNDIPESTEAGAQVAAGSPTSPPGQAPLISPTTGMPLLTLEPETNVQTALEEADELMEQGKYEESLQLRQWFFDHAFELGDPYQHALRLSSSFIGWAELARRYPPAKKALVDIRDSDTQKIASGNGYFELFEELSSINHDLQQDDATCELFKALEKSDPQLAAQCFPMVEGVLAQKGDYETCRRYMGDPQDSFESISNTYQMAMQNQARMKALFSETARRAAEIRIQHGWTNIPASSPPDPSAMMEKMAKNQFIGGIRLLIEILVATGSTSEAEKIQQEAAAVLDDPRLKSAVKDAETKIKSEGIIITAQQLSYDTNSQTMMVNGNPAQVQYGESKITANQLTYDTKNQTLTASGRTEIQHDESLDVLAEQPPVVVETFPPAGARDVAPGETEIRVRFSKAMADGSWSWCTAWQNSVPESVGPPHYLDDQRTCVLDVKLEPGKTYAWWLNSDKFKNFTDIAGQPSVPYLYSFQTKPK